jgi:hypothetical protein
MKPKVKEMAKALEHFDARIVNVRQLQLLVRYFSEERR